LIINKPPISKHISRIPLNAQKVFSGAVFDIYQWPQKMYDGSVKTFEMAKRPNLVNIIAQTANQKFLILKEEQPNKGVYYSLPGGQCDNQEDNQEDFLTAAKRELKEETGFTSQNWQLFMQYSISSKIDSITQVYYAKNCVLTNSQKLDSGEKIEVLEVDKQRFIEIICSDNFYGMQIQNQLMKCSINKTDFLLD